MITIVDDESDTHLHSDQSDRCSSTSSTTGIDSLQAQQLTKCKEYQPLSNFKRKRRNNSESKNRPSKMARNSSQFPPAYFPSINELRDSLEAIPNIDKDTLTKYLKMGKTSTTSIKSSKRIPNDKEDDLIQRLESKKSKQFASRNSVGSTMANLAPMNLLESPRKVPYMIGDDSTQTFQFKKTRFQSSNGPIVLSNSTGSLTNISTTIKDNVDQHFESNNTQVRRSNDIVYFPNTNSSPVDRRCHVKKVLSITADNLNEYLNTDRIASWTPNSSIAFSNSQTAILNELNSSDITPIIGKHDLTHYLEMSNTPPMPSTNAMALRTHHEGLANLQGALDKVSTVNNGNFNHVLVSNRAPIMGSRSIVFPASQALPGAAIYTNGSAVDLTVTILKGGTPDQPRKPLPANTQNIKLPRQMPTLERQPAQISPIQQIQCQKQQLEVIKARIRQFPKIKAKILNTNNGMMLSWTYEFQLENSHCNVRFYHVFSNKPTWNGIKPPIDISDWKKVATVQALPLPMTFSLQRFKSGQIDHFAVLAEDVDGYMGSLSNPCTMRWTLDTLK